jgi:hypothetical protein
LLFFKSLNHLIFHPKNQDLHFKEIFWHQDECLYQIDEEEAFFSKLDSKCFKTWKWGKLSSNYQQNLQDINLITLLKLISKLWIHQITQTTSSTFESQFSWLTSGNRTHWKLAFTEACHDFICRHLQKRPPKHFLIEPLDNSHQYSICKESFSLQKLSNLNLQLQYSQHN